MHDFALAGLIAATLACAPCLSVANSSSGHSSGSTPSRHISATASKFRTNSSAAGVSRDARDRIQHSARAREGFKSSRPCPSTGQSPGSCPGCVIDHVVPIERSGADAPYNMQRQTKEEARQIDRWE